jgi:hypothetical protein
MAQPALLVPTTAQQAQQVAPQAALPLVPQPGQTLPAALVAQPGQQPAAALVAQPGQQPAVPGLGLGANGAAAAPPMDPNKLKFLEMGATLLFEKVRPGLRRKIAIVSLL